MKIVSLSAHFNGKFIQLDDPYELEPDTKLIVTVLPKQLSERDAWLSFSIGELNNAYGEEDEYPLDVIQVANPDYAGS
ncbi:MAG: hypothetical protein HC925_08965 [Coleofasciculaceae cyanobacterium SM2_3_26]|nr:hypothetical protein [Coleofasciculaceae cyanobacterium SM2_3_26]